MDVSQFLDSTVRHLVGRTAWSATFVAGLAAACGSSQTAETVGATTGAFSTEAWVDGDVTSFKAYPSIPGLVYVLGSDGNLWREVGSMSHRTWVDGNVIDYQPFDGNVIYVLGSNGNLWREVGSMASRTLVASNVRSFQVATDGTGYLYYVDTSQTLWETQNGSAPALLAYQVQAFQYASVAPYPLAVGGGDGTWGPGLYVLRPGNALWRGSAVYENHFQIDSNVSSFKAITGLEYFEEGTNGQLWRVSGPTVNVPSARALVDANVASFKPLTGQTIFVEDGSSNLWREEFTARDRTLVDSNVQAYEPIGPNQDTVYVLRKDGNLWLESVAAPLCRYSYAPTACTTTQGLEKGGQNDSFVEVWGVQTLSGTCPAIAAATGTWTEMPASGPSYSPMWLPIPSCGALFGLNAKCCLYEWSSPSGALQDPSVLCTPNNPQMVAYDVCGNTCPYGGPDCYFPGGGGCPVCNSTF